MTHPLDIIFEGALIFAAISIGIACLAYAWRIVFLLLTLACFIAASPADARHHHRDWHIRHSAVPMPRERPRPYVATTWMASAGSPQDRINQAFLVLGWK